jgi:AGCS family alanine or glycine:cation symporter
MVWGIKRGLFSNEAGQGSAPIAHAAAKTDEPVREGTVALMEPFIDTLIVCSITGLVIVTMGVWNQRTEAIAKPGDWTIHAVGASGVNPGSLAELEPFEGHFAVRDGVAAGVILSAYDGTVVEGRLLDTELKPFSGTLQQTAAAGLTMADGSPADIRLQGKMFRTGSAMTAWAFRDGLRPIMGGYGHLIVTIAVFLFGLSTCISWSYYGDRSIHYLFGTRAVLPYRILYVVFVFIGAQLSLTRVWDYGDMALGCMAVPNLIAVILMAPRVVRWTREYYGKPHQRHKRAS